MIFIIGSGFGIYGHLAALGSMGHRVGTLARYRPTIWARPELRSFVPLITWYDTEGKGFEDAESVVLARRPADNAALAEQLIAQGWSGRLIIEKPIADSALAAQLLARRLTECGYRWSVPYLFEHCDWYPQLAAVVACSDRVAAKMVWSFKQSPQARVWKRTPDEGGGALAFYFIHCLALVEAAMPGAACLFSTEDCGTGGRRLGIVATKEKVELSIDFVLDCADSNFTLTIGKGRAIQARTPFGMEPTAVESDPRIPALQRFYKKVVFGVHPQSYAFHKRIIDQWQAFEKLERR